MLRKATAETQPLQNRSSESRQLTLVRRRDPARPTVSQYRLARIQQMQSDIAYMQMELGKEWDSVRADLLGGASVEKGPLRAWIKCILRLGRAKTMGMPRKVAKTLMVR